VARPARAVAIFPACTQRVIGNAGFAEARDHGRQIDSLLEDFKLDLARREEAVRDEVVAASASVTRTTLMIMLFAILVALVLTVLVPALDPAAVAPAGGGDRGDREWHVFFWSKTTR
jgi:hypothetical protein